MNITKATIILNSSADCVILDIDKPPPMPYVCDVKLSVKFDAGYDTGEEYVRTNFPNIPIEIVPRVKI